MTSVESPPSYTLDQWATKVISYSSQGQAEGHRADQILGEPKVHPEYGQLKGAWSQEVVTDCEFIEVAVEDEVYVSGIEVFETYNSGAICRLSVRDAARGWVTVWEGNAELLEQSRIFHPEIKQVGFKTNAVRLDLDLTKAKGPCHIDAVLVIGDNFSVFSQPQPNLSPTKQWPTAAALLERDVTRDDGSSPSHTYPPEVIRVQGTADGSATHSAVYRIAEAVFVRAVHVHEAKNPGHVRSISLRRGSRDWVHVYSGPAVKLSETNRVFRPWIEPTDFKTDAICLEIVTDSEADSCEIQTIRVIGNRYHPLSEPPPTTTITHQWADAVMRHSSEFNISSCSAKQIVGPPSIYPCHGDYAGTWAQGTLTRHEFIEVTVPEKVYVRAIEVYETYHSGAIWRIVVRDSEGRWVPVWAGEPTCQNLSRVFRPPLQPQGIYSNALRLDIDTKIANEWCELDAIMVIGDKHCPSAPPPYVGEFNMDVSQLLGDDKTADMIFVVEGYRIKGHIGVIRARCPGLLPHNGSKESVVDYMSYTVFIHVRRYLYTYLLDEMDIPELILAICQVANYLELHPLKYLCGRNLLHVLSAQEGVLSGEMLSDIYDVTERWMSSPARNTQTQKTVVTFCGATHPVKEMVELKQWVHSVVAYSSQYNTMGWAAHWIIGAPQVYPRYGDIRGCWAQKECNDHEFIEFKLAERVQVAAMSIYETYHGGAVTCIKLKDPDGHWVPVYSAQAAVYKSSRIFLPNLKPTTFKTRHVRLELDCTKAGTWCEIDAVQVISTLKAPFGSAKEPSNEKCEFWASSVIAFSSQYDRRCWNAAQILGFPVVYPSYGDCTGAWAQKTNNSEEYIEIAVSEPILLEELHIYETYNGGGVYKVSVRNPDGHWQVVWRGTPHHVTESRIFKPTLDRPLYPITDVRLDVDCTVCGRDWCELDAVKFIGTYRQPSPADNSSLPSRPGRLSIQFVQAVIGFSSQYNTTGWSAQKIVGTPKVFPHYGDIRGAWAHGTRTSSEFIEVLFLRSVFIHEIGIFETYNAGGVTKVSVRHPERGWVPVWNGHARVIACSRMFKPPLPLIEFKSNAIRLDLDLTKDQTWCEIDAIRVTGSDMDMNPSPYVPPEGPVSQYVSAVVGFSSQNERLLTAEQTIGPPPVYPRHRYHSSAWMPLNNTAAEYIEVEVAQDVYIHAVEVYETRNGGTVTQIDVWDPSQGWVTVWSGKSTFAPTSRVFKPQLQLIQFRTNAVRLIQDLTATTNRIEAINVLGDTAQINPDPAPSRELDGNFIQYANKVTGFSSQYDDSGWSAQQALGPPKVFPRGDIQAAWAQETYTSSEFIEVLFMRSVFIHQIEIFETYNAGGVTKVSVRHPERGWVPVWNGHTRVIARWRIFKPPLPLIEFKSNAIRLDLDLTKAQTWCQIEAIKVTGSDLDMNPSPYVPPEGPLSQYVSAVLGFSSQNEGLFAAKQTIGPPRVYPRHGYHCGAWLPLNNTAAEYIEVEVAHEVYIHAVEVYETGNGGTVTQIDVLDPSQGWVTVWSGESTLVPARRVFKPQLQLIQFRTDAVRLILDLTGTITQIDAIKVIGDTAQINPDPAPPHDLDGSFMQYADKVTGFSSQYDDSGWSAQQALGPPKVYPRFGDIPGAWAQGTFTDKEYIQVTIPEAVYVHAIHLYETYNAGAVTEVALRHPERGWTPVWRGRAHCISSTRIFTPPIASTDFKSQAVMLLIDASTARNWCLIDAIKVIGHNEKPKPKGNEAACLGSAPESTSITMLSQFASRVLEFSSQRDSTGWIATQILGAPRVYPHYGDIRGAWAQLTFTDAEFIEVEIERPVFIHAIHIYETYHAGAVTEVTVRHPDRGWVNVWSGTPRVIRHSRVFTPDLQPTDFKSKAVRLVLDTAKARTWCEIDAIRVIGSEVDIVNREHHAESAVGTSDLLISPGISQTSGHHTSPGITQYANRVLNFSSQYDSLGWSAQQILGAPQVYPAYGDIQGAWAQRTYTSAEYIEVSIEQPVCIHTIELYETYHAGAVTEVAARHPEGHWVTVWCGTPQVIRQSRIFKPDLRAIPFKSDAVRLIMDLTGAGTWCEVDAIRVTGSHDNSHPG